MSRLDAKPVDELQLKRIQALNAAARYLEYRINDLCPKGRERKIALQRLEEVVMWANKAISQEVCSND
ncbi:MAG: hypothetical protein HPZ77_00805 [Acidaminococcaceae bacterium]|jgi:hypothetical protein|nr:hypothetical protein [Acidaminococcaceae bacterium]DAL83958.1 MAG TPA: hypothetical protein [Caudoviricetes sp.]